MIAALVTSVPTFADDSENVARVYLSHPSPDGHGRKGLYTLKYNLDGNKLIGVEELRTIVNGLDGNSFDDLEFDGLQYRAAIPSETAAYFFKKGERLYENNKLDKAERAFKASLRAQDGGLETYSYLFLAHIAKRKGDKEQARAYAERFFLQNRPPQTN